MNLTGFWVGEYRYSSPGEPTVPFFAAVDDKAGAISGSISEPNVYSNASALLFSIVRGSRDSRSVEFAKVYDAEADFAHRVDYVGTLSGDGCSVEGRWQLEDWYGSFSMSRTMLSTADTADEILETLAEAK
jgi:hypothetical protein